MDKTQSFGGKWTQEKLSILTGYLDYYMKVLKNQTYFKKIYIDAFAGSGHIDIGHGESYEIEGSASLALKVSNPFDEYIFIEKNRCFAEELEEFVYTDYPDLSNRITVINGDCNKEIKNICNKFDWERTRGVLFLDPYSMGVKWETLKSIAKTNIDLWYLFPFGATNRLMKNSGDIPLSWQNKITEILGDNAWKVDFYQPDDQMSLFDMQDKVYKCVNTDRMKQYIIERLKTVFPCVADNPRVLYNKKNSPLFLFCFAITNKSEKAQELALKGAKYILGKREL